MNPKETMQARIAGAVLIGAGLLLLGINALLLQTAERFFPSALTMGFVAIPLGEWFLATGRSYQTPDNPLWWKAAHGALLVVGLISGLYVAFVAL